MSAASIATPPVRRSSRYRSDEVLEQAVQLCGREISPGRYRLSMSQRALARELDMSITNFRRHLDQAGDQVIALKPLCIQLRIVTAPPTFHSKSNRGDRTFEGTPERAANPDMQPDATSDEASDFLTPAGLAAELLGCAAAMHATAATLMERAAALLATERANTARFAPGQGGGQGAKRAAFTEVSQSDSSFPTNKNTDCLTSHQEPARDHPARNAPVPTPRAVPQPRQLSDDELARLIEPLMNWCAKTNTPGIDPAGLRRLSTFSADEVQAGVAHTLNQVKAQPTIRRAFGLLINMLTNGDIPPRPTVKPPTTQPIAEPDTPPDPELWALAQQCATGTAFWETHIAPTFDGITSRCPTGELARTGRIYATFTEHPHLASTALEWATNPRTAP